MFYVYILTDQSWKGEDDLKKKKDKAKTSDWKT